MANDTPESDFSIECFQNYSAPEVFVQGLAGMVNQNDVETVIRAQKNIRLRAASTEFKKHTQLLLEMRKDLEFIFKKIRAIKTKLSTQYPEAYKSAVAASIANRRPADDDDDEDFKASETRPESKMVATVSTETLKPTTSDTGKKSKKKDMTSDESNNNKEPSVANEENPKTVGRKVKRNSSSSETESASSGDDSSTDTG
ncbi:hypothetical protein SFRURICE_011173 [Spodoptera frugiperda]|nr:hypothetical protein SFRURICE_011173 [Spodoptera frugiperda]